MHLFPHPWLHCQGPGLLDSWPWVLGVHNRFSSGLCGWGSRWDFVLALSVQSGSSCHGWSSIILRLLTWSSQKQKARNGRPEAPFCFGLDSLSTMLICLLLTRIRDWSRLRGTKSGRLVLICCSGGTVPSSKCWGLLTGCPSQSFSPLPPRCHPQVYGHPSVMEKVTRQPFRSLVQ